MKHFNFLLIAFLSVLIPCMLYAGTAYYVNCECQHNGNGTDGGCAAGANQAGAFNNIPAVNNKTFADGDDVYFKVNTTCVSQAALNIDWNGTSSDRVIIGAYHSSGIPGLGGNSRPVFNGQDIYPLNDQHALIRTEGYNYITVQDIKAINSTGYGVSAKKCDYCIVDNCITNHTVRQGIIIVQSDYGVISNNDVSDCVYKKGIGGCIVVGHPNTSNNTVTRNVVHATKSYTTYCSEGINIARGPINTILEYNTVYDCDYSIYSDSSTNSTIRYNLVYSSPATLGIGQGIHLEIENLNGVCRQGGNKVYGNFIASMGTGIALSNEYQRKTDGACTSDNNKIYNNTIVDSSKYNISIKHGPDQGGGTQSSWSGNEIKNNISWTLSPGSNHVSGFSVPGVAWSNNLFDEAVSGNAMNNAVIGNPELSKTSGWRNITAGSLTPNDFKLANTGSAAYNAGADLGGTPYNLDYWGTNRDNNTPWDIGAHELSSASVDNVDPAVTDFVVTPATINEGQSITANYTITDETELIGAELWRAPDSGGSPGTWTKVATNNHSGKSAAGSFIRTPAAGIWWYGMHAVDAAGNWAPASPHGPDKVTVSEDTTAPAAPTGLTIVE